MASASTPAPVFWSENKHQLSSYDEPQLHAHVHALILKNQYKVLINCLRKKCSGCFLCDHAPTHFLSSHGIWSCEGNLITDHLSVDLLTIDYSNKKKKGFITYTVDTSYTVMCMITLQAL